jgi:iron complex outermembrane receptor protein
MYLLTAREYGYKTTPEKSTNVSFGFGAQLKLKPIKIIIYKVKDRIVLGNLVDFGTGGNVRKRQLTLPRY